MRIHTYIYIDVIIYIYVYLCIYVYIYSCGSCADEGMAEALLELGCSIFDDEVWGADVVIRVACGACKFGLRDVGLRALGSGVHGFD